MFVRISGVRAQIFLETENIGDINIRSGSGLNDGDVMVKLLKVTPVN